MVGRQKQSGARNAIITIECSHQRTFRRSRSSKEHQAEKVNGVYSCIPPVVSRISWPHSGDRRHWAGGGQTKGVELWRIGSLEPNLWPERKSCERIKRLRGLIRLPHRRPQKSVPVYEDTIRIVRCATGHWQTTTNSIWNKLVSLVK